KTHSFVVHKYMFCTLFCHVCLFSMSCIALLFKTTWRALLISYIDVLICRSLLILMGKFILAVTHKFGKLDNLEKKLLSTGYRRRGAVSFPECSLYSSSPTNFSDVFSTLFALLFVYSLLLYSVNVKCGI
uniref:Gustatory receptor n=1 Tax=Parascaris univalens TaxID=6257 RepID=A0A915BEP1_PARUN